MSPEKAPVQLVLLSRRHVQQPLVAPKIREKLREQVHRPHLPTVHPVLDRNNL